MHRVELESQANVERELLLLLAKQIRPIESHRVHDPRAEVMRLTRAQRAVTLTNANGRESAWEKPVRFARRQIHGAAPSD